MVATLGSVIKIKEMNEICGDIKLNFDEYIYESVQRFPFTNINEYKKKLIKTDFQIGNEYLKSAIFNEIFKALSNKVGDAVLVNNFKPLLILFAKAWGADTSQVPPEPSSSSTKRPILID